MSTFHPNVFQRILEASWIRLLIFTVINHILYFLIITNLCRGMYSALGQPLSCAISFFLNEKKINIFRLMHIALFLKVTYCIQILLKKIHILYCFSWKVTFSMSKVKFSMFGFIETKRFNIDSFTNENWNKFKCHRSKVSRRKEKKVCC